MKTFKIQDREAGNIIARGLNYQDAVEIISSFEDIDKKEGTYTPDFYEIKEETTT